ncbi:hypothetical protein MAE02_23200 [Microvirga aerophila]|uniref:Uncharacterized protein n=1 Tax=Microvirga aerophila TaxID=670291 RepID=A0A512BRU5_9HYPH|nr:hypothetical protein MAE02_23200 [Microvirga aerophila]
MALTPHVMKYSNRLKPSDNFDSASLIRRVVSHIDDAQIKVGRKEVRGEIAGWIDRERNVKGWELFRRSRLSAEHFNCDPPAPQLLANPETVARDR